MTSATIRLTSPTHAEERLLRLAARLTRYVEHRIERRAERRTIALDVLREQQTRRQDPHAVDHALAQLGLPRR